MQQNRRQQQQQQQQQQTSAFRVLSAGRQQLQYEVQAALHRSAQPPPPPPPRAPEPYKLATPRRSQRKSAFAIIAEPPASSASGNNNDRANSTSRPTSPTGFPASGRVSPFRGRGFKGPPPRSRSRPHTPPRGNSAQTSPRRSLSQIPRPSNNNKVAPLSSSRDDLTASSRKASPKFGRRAISNNNNNNNNNRYTSSVGSNNQRNGQTIKSPTKRSPPTSNGKLKQKAPNSGHENNNKLIRVPAKNPAPSGKRFITANNNNNSNNSNNNNNNNVNRINVAPKVKQQQQQQQQQQQNGTNDNSPESPSKIPLRNGHSSLSASREMLSKPSKNLTKSNGYEEKDARDSVNKMGKSTKDPTSEEQASTSEEQQQDLGLVDLLKQSSSATGTQSVVNTTTTTAVQPLQIDASSILAEAELVAKLSSLEKKQQEQEARAADEVTNTTVTRKEGTKEKDDEKGKNGPYAQAMIKHFGPNASEDKRTAIIGNVQVEPHKVMAKETANSSSVTAAVAVEKQPKEPESSTMMQAKQDEQSKSSNASSSKKASARNSPNGSTRKASNNSNSNNSKKNNVETSLQAERSQVTGGSSESLGSIRSTDTGVSLNTVRGVSSAKEKTGIHMVKRAEEIETLSGNVVHADSNGERALGADSSDASAGGNGANINSNKAGTKWSNWKNRLVKRLGCVAKRPSNAAKTTNCWPKMRCLACRRDHPKAQLWPGKKARGASTIQLTAPTATHGDRSLNTRWDRFKDAFRCTEWRERRRRRRLQRLQVAPLERRATTTAAPAIVTARKCCPLSFGALCRGLFSKCTCCGRRRASLQSERSSKRSKSVRAKHSLTSVAGPPLSEKKGPKLHETLVESNSVMRGAIPCLPIPVAWFCLIFNVVIPGSGTLMSGMFNLCMGQPRFSNHASSASRFGAFVVDLIVGVSQLFTVLFCLVGWGWSIWWGVTMVRLARKWKRFKESEALANDPEAHRAGPETATLPAPGIPPLSSLRPTPERPR